MEEFLQAETFIKNGILQYSEMQITESRQWHTANLFQPGLLIYLLRNYRNKQDILTLSTIL